VAAFTEPDLSDGTGEFAATINWGDGSSSSGTITESGGVFRVLGSHTYATSGLFPIQVEVSQAWSTYLPALLLPVTTAMVPGPGEDKDKPDYQKIAIDGVAAKPVDDLVTVP
jgi:hypothetical protein